MAATLQHSLLPEPPPSDPRGSLAARYLPAVKTLEVGGDWYDAFAVAQDTVALVVGDVVGRGLEAATTMGRLQSASRALLLAGFGPAEALARLDAFAASVPPAQVATMVVATVGLDDGATRIACAATRRPRCSAPVGRPSCLVGPRRAAGLRAPGRRAHGRGAVRCPPAPACCSTPTAWWSVATGPTTRGSPRWWPSCPPSPARACTPSSTR